LDKWSGVYFYIACLEPSVDGNVLVCINSIEPSGPVYSTPAFSAPAQSLLF